MIATIDGIATAIATILVGLLVLAGQVYNGHQGRRIRKAVNGDLHDRLDMIEHKVDAHTVLLDRVIEDRAVEKVERAYRQAELDANLAALRKTPKGDGHVD